MGFKESSLHHPDAANTEQLARAKTILEKRDQVIDRVAGPFWNASQKIWELFNQPETAVATSELRPGATREVYRKLLAECSEVERMRFGGQGWSDAHPLFQIFGYGFNKLKTDQGMKLRTGSDRSIPISYPVHTHVDVVYFMQTHELGKSSLSIALAALHDVTEEGWRILRDQNGGSKIEAIKPTALIDKFPQDNLGRMLAVGIPALTETEFKDLRREPAVGERKIEALRQDPAAARLLAEARRQFLEIAAERLDKHFIQDPLAFGGLALQLSIVMDKLFARTSSTLSIAQREQLAVSILEVELGDRMSDMAELTRIIKKRTDPTPVNPQGDTPAYARHRVLLYSSRMLNMFEKIQTAAVARGYQKQFSVAFDGYRSILGVELEEINKLMASRAEYRGLPSITFDEVTAFYKEQFSPLQRVAEKQLCPFLDSKVERILQSASV